MVRRRWRDLSTGQRGAFVAMVTAQVGLGVMAWIDLAQRPAERVHGHKPWWAAAIAVNFLGPIAYMIFGRVRPPHQPRDDR